MKYPLEELLRVRLHREDVAQSAVVACREKVRQAEHELQNRKNELAEYIDYRQQREEALYQEIMEQEVQMRDLDDLKVNISLLQQKQFEFEDLVQAAKRELEEAEAELAQAQAVYAATVKERQKIDEHKAVWAQEDAKHREAELEKEMEDFRVRKAEEADAVA